MPLPKGIKKPIIVGCTDGVGTKLAIAQHLGIHDTIGYDLVGMNVNDLICSGAKPMFFLDYFACGKLDVGVAETVIKGIVAACKESDCELLGGETAEMPGFYDPGEYDLAGFATGVVDADKKLNPKKTVKKGDVLLGIPSSGLHSNGYSLVRKVFQEAEWGDKKDWLLAPTRLYVRPALKVLSTLNKGKSIKVKGFVHITGGGFIDNIPRILPDTMSAVITLGSWPVLPVFQEIEARAGLKADDMYRTFNMGIGLVAAVDPSAVAAVQKIVGPSYVIGRVEKGNGTVVLN
jgi:phosphoribosylformylglycinamidine cyclo-ligase